MALPTYIHGKVVRLKSLWMRRKIDSRLIITTLKQHVDVLLFPNILELLKIQYKIFIKRMETEGYFWWKTDPQLTP